MRFRSSCPAAPRARGRAAAILVAATLALAATGCDGDDGGTSPERAAQSTDAAQGSRTTAPSERRAIRAAIVRLFMSEDVRVACERTLTPRLFRLIYSGPAGCRKAESEADDEDEKPVRRIDASDIRASGGSATAHVLLVGGDAAGANGRVALRKADGDWRVDDLSLAFLRSSVKAALRSDEDIPRVVGACMNGRFTRIPDGEFKRFAYGLVGRKPPATRRLLRTLSGCDRGGRGVSVIRRSFEKDASSELAQAGADRKGIACVLRRLRSTVPDKLMIELAARDDRRSKQRLTREVVAAAIACGTGGRTGPGQLSPA